MVFENTHEALVSKETWEIVQKNRQNRCRPTKMGDMGMFSGLLYCADCGHTLHLNRTKSWARDKDNYTCGTYKREKGQCTAHFIRAVVLEQLVLENLREVISFAREDTDAFVQPGHVQSHADANAGTDPGETDAGAAGAARQRDRWHHQAAL